MEKVWLQSDEPGVRAKADVQAASMRVGWAMPRAAADCAVQLVNVPQIGNNRLSKSNEPVS